MTKAERPDKERLKKMVKTGARYTPKKKAPVKKKAKKDLSYYIKKLKKSVKKIFDRERQINQNRADRSIGRGLRRAKVQEEDIIKMGYAPKKKGKK